MSLSWNVSLAPLWFICTLWWCHREISKSIQIVALVILTAAMCVSPAISAYLPGDNVMTTEGWCHCHPMCAQSPGDHVACDQCPGPLTLDCSLQTVLASRRPLSGRAPGSSRVVTGPGPNPCWVMWGHHGLYRPQLVQCGWDKIQCLAIGKTLIFQ